MATVNWGILGTAGIAQKVCVAINGASNARVYAIASRDKARAEAYVEEHAPGAKAYGSYDELLEDPAVQVVYLPLPTGVRHEWLLKAARMKKHVLSEKPLSPTTQGARELIEACEAAGVQWMDNTMLMHNQLIHRAQRVLDDEAVMGSIKHVSSCFSFPFGADAGWAQSNIRMSKATEPLGCLGDLGWYCVRATLLAFKYDLPEAVSCHFLEQTDEGVPTRVVATLKFPAGRSASFDCSFMHALRQWLEITGSNAVLRVPDFVIPGAEEQSFTVERMDIADRALFCPTELLKKETVSCLPHQELIQNFSKIALSGQLEVFWPEVSLKTQQVINALAVSARKDGEWVVISGDDGGALVSRL